MKISLPFCCILGVVPLTASATGWEFEPAVSLTELYSDNIGLASVNEMDEFVTQVNPTFVADYESQKLQADINYRMQNIFYQENDESNETFHQFDGDITANLGGAFFFDFEGRYSQQIIDPEQQVSFNNSAITENQANVASIRVSPYWFQTFSSGLRALVRYSQSVVNYDSNNPGNLQDSDSAAGQVLFGDDSAGNFFQWNIQYNWNETEFDDQERTMFEQLALELGLAISQRAVIFGVFGVEENEFGFMPSGEDPNDTFWNVGLRWNSLPRDSFELFVGERFFGDTLGLNWQHQGPYIGIALSYSEEILTDAQARLGEPVFSDTGFVENNLSRATLDVFLSKRLEYSLRFNRSRTSVLLSVASEIREFQEDDEEEKSLLANLRWQWDIGARSNFFTSANIRQDDFLNSEREDELKELRLGFVFGLGPRTNTEIFLRQSRLESNFVDVEYEENAINFSFTRAF